MVLKKQRAYTLIEIVVVLVIITILAVMAIPAFMNYGKKQDLNQKAEEVKQLMNQTYLLARNPEKDALSYELTVNMVTNPKKFVLRKCKEMDPATFRCIDDPTKYVIVKEVKLLTGQTIQNPNTFISCSTNPSENCQLDINPISIFDSNINGNNTVVYTFKTPFSVEYNLGT